MKNQWILALGMLTSLVGWTGSEIEQNEQDDVIVDTQQELADLRSDMEELTKKVENSDRVTRETIAYLEGLGKTATAMQTTLESSEKAGFTAGINPESRTILLDGWRKQLERLQKGIPSYDEKAEKDGEDEAEEKRRYPKRWK